MLLKPLLSTTLLVPLFFCVAVLACEEPHQLSVMDKPGGNSADLVIPPPVILDATVNLELSLDNMQANSPMHSTFDLHNWRRRDQPWVVAHLERVDYTKPFYYHFHQHYTIGNLGGRPDGTIYALPYTGEKHRIFQGYNGTFTHLPGSSSQYALDFGMPVGTTVCAARNGIVVATRADSNEGGGDKKYKECANFVIIRHSDGTYAEYAHLNQNGVLVNVRQRVSVGQSIGLSGQTGMAQDPHLHFMVFVPIDGYNRRSFPTQFATPEGIVSELQQGHEY